MKKKPIKIIAWLVGICAGFILIAACCVGAYLAYRYYNNQRGNQASTSNKVNITQIAPELAPFGELASLHSQPLTVTVDPSAKRIPLDDGASLQIPAGAFSTSTQLQVTRVDMAFDRVAFDVKQSMFYILSTPNEVGTLATSVILEVLIPSSNVAVTSYDGQNWQPIEVHSGQTTRVEITHFSPRALGFVEFLTARNDELTEILDTDANTGKLVDRLFIEQQTDDMTRSFFGVNESAVTSQDQMCNDLTSIVSQYNTSSGREFPDAADLHAPQLVFHLFENDPPSVTNDYFWKLTADSMAEINIQVLASTEPLSPAQFLQIAIDANNGNIPLGVLAAHEYLKDKTKLGRAEYSNLNKVSPEYAAMASHLQSWREGDNLTPIGMYDKMGPLYHIFAAMTAELWLPNRASGDAAITAEAYLRSSRTWDDRPDPQKGAADQCGVDVTHWLLDHAATNQIVTAKQSPATTEVDRNYTGQISVKFYLDAADNTWKCDDSALYTYTFTLHFYTDGSIMMDNNNFDDKAITGAFHFQPDSSTPGKFIGSDPSSADTVFLFPDGSNGDMSKLTYISILNEPDGNPGTCSFEYTQATSNP